MNKKKIGVSGAIIAIFSIMMLSCVFDDDNGGGGTNPTSPITPGNPENQTAGYPDSMKFISGMTVGWNLGNSLDAHWDTAPYSNVTTSSQQETMWGNPVTTKAMIDAIKAKGFNTIRVPVTWYMFTGAAPDYKISDVWMNRVKDVVDYVIDNGMYCILNTHHEDYHWGTHEFYGNFEIGWLRLYYTDRNGTQRALTSAEKQAMNNRLRKLWEQIADKFKNYGEKLIFEGVNEPRTKDGMPDNVSRTIRQEENTVLNELLQTFVDTVRASGGNNTWRHLMVAPYFASLGTDPNSANITDFVDTGAKKLKINDPSNRLIVSVHYYEPYYFASADPEMSESLYTYNTSDSHISWNTGRIQTILRDYLINNGIPVIMGETGANDSTPQEERVKWANHYIKMVNDLGIPVVMWDDGGGFKLFNRENRTWYYPSLVDALVEVSKNVAKAPVHN